MPTYTFQELEEVKQAQMRSHLQLLASIEAQQAIASAAAMPSSTLFASPFNAVQADKVARKSSGANGTISGSTGTIDVRQNPMTQAGESDHVPGMVFLAIGLLMIGVLLYALLRGTRR
jgi:hypothetical protein